MTAEHVLDKLEERCTGMQRPEEFRRVPGVFSLKDEPTGEIRPYTTDSNEEYILSLTVGCRYWANSVQHRESRRNAESIIANLLYADVLAELSEIQHAIYDGDKMASLTRVVALMGRLRR